ncbi:Nucleolar protein 16 [Termitomyces sp. T112]|nr:Nucleolar protein 16 [Termitomyces sp. T112]KAH0584046.1 hypothetical protein H2248_009620 [Termitomyces sp. 'cryptogamus']KNZ75353.1 Nucleolar protein 16 [Termitomyces sp. J132]
MANPRQRRKARSSSHKAVSHSRHAKRNLKKMPPIRGPKILQDAWDKTKTVRQNYIALGLVHDLNPTASGGSERIEVRSQIEESQIASTSQLESAPPIPKGFGKIIRDDAGNVLRIELPQDDSETRTEKRQDESLHEPEVDGAVLGPWVTDLGGGTKIKMSNGDGNVVRALERISKVVQQNGTTLEIPLSGSGGRHVSAGEMAYLGRLVEKYGEDVSKMARDRRLNAEQRTAGALGRALKKAGLIGRS